MSAGFSFQALGTTWAIDIFDLLSATALQKLEADVKARVEAFEAAYSRFRPDSFVAKARVPGTYSLPYDAEPLFKLYRELYDATNGLVTPLIGVTLSDAGYDESYSLVSQKTIRHPKPWDDVMRYKAPNLVVKEPIMLDFGAAGKGYCIDIVAGILRKAGIEGYIVEAGGDMIHRGPEAMKVGLEDPEDATKMVGVAHIRDKSICGSAGNRRAWGNFHHVMNPETGMSPQHILALWTVADTAALADGLATALFFTAPEELAKRFSFEYAILYADRSAEVSHGFPGELFKDKKDKI